MNSSTTATAVVKQEHDQPHQNGSSSSRNDDDLVLGDRVKQARAALNNALLQVGLILRFQRDVSSLGVDRYASRPPGNLTSALAAAVQSYEAACDSLEQELMLAKAVILRDFDADKATQRVKQEEEAGIEERQMQRGGADATTEGAATERGDGDDAAKTAQNLKREDEETGKQADSQKGQDARTGEPTAAMMIDLTDSPRAKGDEQGQVQTETKQGTTSSSNVIAIPDDDDDDMEDLFASKSNAHSSAIATPAATVAAASDPTSAKPQELLPSSDVEGVTHPAPAPATDVPAPDLMDDLPENLDFSSLSAEDFNALLANLGSSVDGLSGGAGSGTDMLAGFDLSSLLGGGGGGSMSQ